MKALLVKPPYYSAFPPLGLLKLSTLLNLKGYTPTGPERYHQGPNRPASFQPDEIYITSLFTYSWKPVHASVFYYRQLYPRAKIFLGGLYASLLPEHAKTSGAEIHEGLLQEAEELLPDYSLVPDWDGSIIFSSRGCIRKCPFCAVPRLEKEFMPKKTITHLINSKHKRVILWDNNFLASPYWHDILSEIKERKLWVDFNQGIDSRLLDHEKAEMIASMKMRLIRTAYDSRSSRKQVQRGIEMLSSKGVSPRKIIMYMLFNFENDTPQDLLDRILDAMEWGVVSYPMRFQPVELPYALRKDSYIAKNWNEEELEMVADARRVLGYHGAFAPYNKLREKFQKANDLREALVLRPKRS
ncbi:radical SAM protein [Candidatus Bathyarchaeota archaeon]|nr:radical SAM protein [Candidatus Bathyarchaeota archaeon]